jgi:YD repeat-containing protein
VSWSFPDSSAVSDAVVRSQSGRILEDTLTDTGSSPVTDTSTYSYDAAGRLVEADIPDHTLTYGFAGSGGCGADAAAGKDGNRTSFADNHTSVGTTTVGYCYDNADRLTATSVSGAPSGADPLLAANLTTAGGTPSLAYDVQGNTTTLADETLTYDAAGDNIGTTQSGRRWRTSGMRPVRWCSAP